MTQTDKEKNEFSAWKDQPSKRF